MIVGVSRDPVLHNLGVLPIDPGQVVAGGQTGGLKHLVVHDLMQVRPVAQVLGVEGVDQVFVYRRQREPQRHRDLILLDHTDDVAMRRLVREAPPLEVGGRVRDEGEGCKTHFTTSFFKKSHLFMLDTYG